MLPINVNVKCHCLVFSSISIFILKFNSVQIKKKMLFLSKLGPNNTRNSYITQDFSCKFVKKICKKIFFSVIFPKNFNL